MSTDDIELPIPYNVSSSATDLVGSEIGVTVDVGQISDTTWEGTIEISGAGVTVTLVS